MRRTRLLWKLLLVFFAGCAVAAVVAWGVLLTTICSNPRTPVPATQHVIAYGCHGMTVFISPLQETLLHWLIPVEVLCILLGVIAAAMVVLGALTVRVDVRIQRTDAPRRSPDREGGRDA